MPSQYDNDPGSTIPRSWEQICCSISTLGFFGRSPVAPGTVGSLVAALLARPLFLHNPLWLKGILLVALFFVGGWCAGQAERVMGRKDPGQVVIDEVLGQWIVFLPFTQLGLWQLAAGFVLFRIFDIAKPWPVRASEKWLPGGYGIMIDDVLAGLYAMICLWGCIWGVLYFT
ncbi:MAG: phosphatidylglycerophosphatase A [Desulfovibrio sp.]|uniref:phosphatidylglycerophosphatase A family protein n=1 Tax=Desulfovibrio sp. 7SRBS1 TaxID=3378064 RepID=UPI003B40D7BC